MILLLALLAAEPWEALPSVPPQWIGGSEARRVEQPRRIVSVAPSVTEFLFAFGAGSRVVGVSRYDDYPPEATKRTHVGGFLDPNVEVILALEPDLVIAVSNSHNRTSLERLASLRIPTLVVPGNSFADTFHAGTAIANAVGGRAPEIARGLLGVIRSDVAEVRQRGPAHVRALFVYDHNPLIVAGPGSFADTMLAVIGAKNVVKVDVAYPPYSFEQLLVDAPEVILDASVRHVSTSTAALWGRWKTIPAVRHGRVHAFDATLMMRAGPRIGEALKAIAELLRTR